MGGVKALGDEPGDATRDALGDGVPGDVGEVRLSLPGGVDFGDDNGVGQGQCLSEAVGEGPGAGEQVRLEQDQDPTAALLGHAARRAQQGLDLRGVVGVVVDDAHTVGFAPVLEAPARPPEGTQCPGHPGRFDAELDARGPGSGGVEGHVVPGYGQHQLDRAVMRLLARTAGGLAAGCRGEGQQPPSG